MSKSNKKSKSNFRSTGASRGHTSGSPSFSSPTSSRGKPISSNRRHGFSSGKRPYDYSFYEQAPATREYMSKLFSNHDFPVTDTQLSLFWQYYELLRDRNASLDLTRIMGIEATVLKHFIDSAIVGRYVSLKGVLLDIGSGPGFPGLPLAIMYPNISVILAESRGKRVTFLEELLGLLRLPSVQVWSRSVREDSPFGLRYHREVNQVITRALEVISPTLQRVLPFLPIGGQVIFLKGPQCDLEISEALSNFGTFYSLSQDISYDLPRTNQHRRLVVFDKISDLSL